MPEDDSLTHKQDLLTHKRDLLTHKKRLMKCLRTEVGQLLFDSLCASGSILCFLVIKCFFITKKLQRCNNVDGCQWWASTVSQASSGSSSSSIFAVNIVVSDGQANFCFCQNNKRIIIVVSDEQASSNLCLCVPISWWRMPWLRACPPQRISSTVRLCWVTFHSPLLLALCAAVSGGGG